MIIDAPDGVDLYAPAIRLDYPPAGGQSAARSSP
jgi:hypothetical protein